MFWGFYFVIYSLIRIYHSNYLSYLYYQWVRQDLMVEQVLALVFYHLTVLKTLFFLLRDKSYKEDLYKFSFSLLCIMLMYIDVLFVHKAINTIARTVFHLSIYALSAQKR